MITHFFWALFFKKCFLCAKSAMEFCRKGVFCSRWTMYGLRCEERHPNDEEFLSLRKEPCELGEICFAEECRLWHPPKLEKEITYVKSRPFITRCKTCHKPPKECVERHSEDYQGTDHTSTYSFPLTERIKRVIRCQGILTQTGFQCGTKVNLGSRSDARPFCPRHR